MSTVLTETLTSKGLQDLTDLREQLSNEREIGPFHAVQLLTEQIAQLHGFFLDIDRHLIRPGQFVPGVEGGPAAFYEQTVRHWLDRDLILADAEVRSSGEGLHILIWFAEPLIFATDAQRERCAGIVEAVQSILAVDPHQPGITGLTRPLGSVNGKTGAIVTRLKEGTPVPVDRVERLFEQMQKTPFSTVMKVLMGSDRIQPCPICRADGTTLTAGDLVGFCYGTCGKVKLSRLYDLFFTPPKARGKEAAHDEHG